jgi:SatD family (SatD)
MQVVRGQHGTESEAQAAATQVAKKHIILMADVIGSSLLEPQEMQTFFEVVEEANLKFEQQLTSLITVTLGDEFQAIVANQKALIDILVYLEERLVARGSRVLLRYVVHKGTIESQLHHRRAHAMIGPGLTFARKKLEAMKKGDDRFFIHLGTAKLDNRLNKALKVWGSFLQSWKESDKHLELAASFLQYEDYKLVAEKRGAERGNMWRMEKSLRFSDYVAQRELLPLLL